MSDTARKTHPIGELLLCFVGPTVWAAHFFVMYGTEALICTGTVATLHNRYFLPIAGAATVLALISLLCFVAWQLIWSRRNDAVIGNRDAPLFVRNTSTALAALSILGVLWVALPAVVLPPCTPP